LKSNKLIKIVSSLFALVVLMAAVPATSVAAGSITLSPTSGTVGTVVTVSGSGFLASTQYRVYFSNQEANLGQDIDNALTTYHYLGIVSTAPSSGDIIPKNYTIPSAMTSGTEDENVNRDGIYYFYVTEEAESSIDIVGKTTFRVSGFSSAQLSDDQGFVDDEVTVTGEGYKPGEQIQLFWDGADITDSIIEGDEEVDSTGDFEFVFLVPEDEYGPHELVVQGDESFSQAEFEFSIMPSITIDPVEGGAGVTVLVSGKGFDGRNYVDIYLGNTLIEKTASRTSTLGSFAEQVTIPTDTQPGTYVIEAVDEDDDDIFAAKNFAVILLLDPVITLEPSSGKVGDTVSVSGVEFNPAKSISLSIDGTAVTPVSPITSTAEGTFSGSFVIPELAAGTHTLEATASGGVETTATFTVSSEITMTPATGKAGTEVTVTGTGFGAARTVTVYFKGEPVATTPSPATTSSKGSFSCTFKVPAVADGSHAVEVRVGDATVVKNFTTSIEFSIAPTSGKAGTKAVITASGFAPSSSAVITFGNAQLTTTTTTSQGSLSVEFTVPAVAEGTYPVKVEVAGISVSKNFTTSADVSFSPSSGPVGTQVAITGTGFGASKPLSLTWDGQTVEGSTGLTTTAEGAFNVAFAVPPVQGGNYTISISDGTVTKTHTFAVSASTPPIPQPLSPALKSRLTGSPTFDWNPVSYDIMAVTYELQIARDASFTTLVLEKTGLTATEYTLAATEKLEKAGQDNPYFWRVRAVDAAGNASGWTGAADFYYGSTWPAWLTWVLIGLGVVVLGMLTFWIGRRIAYYSY